MKSSEKRERVFFITMASFFLIANIIGFGFSLNSRMAKEGALAYHIYVHGICAGLWILLYFIQTTLIATRNTSTHMRLGKAGYFVLLLVLASGFYVAFMVPVIYQVDPPHTQPGRDFSAILLAVAVAFFGLKYRKQTFIHKRLMMVATLILSSAGIARAVKAVGLASSGPAGIISMLFLPVIALFIYDYITHKKIFKVNLIGLSSIFLLFVLSAPPFWDNALFQPVLQTLIDWLT